jgi:hypothetical protein
MMKRNLSLTAESVRVIQSLDPDGLEAIKTIRRSYFDRVVQSRQKGLPDDILRDQITGEAQAVARLLGATDEKPRPVIELLLGFFRLVCEGTPKSGRW